MKKELEQIAENMKELGLAALAHVNNIRLMEDRWSGILSVLQVAHSGQQQPNLLPCQMDTPCTRCCRDIRPRTA